jgi:hypothetical protein
MALATLTIDLVAKLAKFESDLGRTAQIVQAQSDKMNKAFSAVRGTIAGLAAAAGLGAFVGQIKNAANTADELGKISARTGVAVESLSALKYAAELSDVSLEELTGGLQKLNKAIDADSDAFKRLGLSARDFKSPDQALAAVADKFAAMEDHGERAAIAMELFGKTGDRLIPLLAGGSAGLEAMRAEAERLGVVFTAEAARSAEEFNDNMTRMGIAMQGVAAQIGNAVIPAINQLAQEFLTAREHGESLLGALWQVATTNTSDAGNQILALEDKLQQVKQTRAAFEKMGPVQRFFSGDDIAILEKQQGVYEKELRFLKEIQTKRAAAAMGGPTGHKLPPKPAGPSEDEQKKTEAAQKQFDQRIEAMQRELAGVQKLSEADRLRGEIARGVYSELTEAQRGHLVRMAEEIDKARASADAQKEAQEKIAEAGRKRAAAEEKARAEAEQATAAFITQAEAFAAMADPSVSVQRQIDELDKLQQTAHAITPEYEAIVRLQLELQEIGARYSGPAEQYLRAIDPTRAYREELEKIAALERKGRLSTQEAAQARGQVEEKRTRELFPEMDKWTEEEDRVKRLEEEYHDLGVAVELGVITADQALRRQGEIQDELTGKVGKAKSAAEEFGLTFASAFEDAIVSGKDLDSIVQGLTQDLLRMSVRKGITEPMMDWFTGAMKGGGGAPAGGAGGGWGGWMSALAGFFMKDGGIMTAHGPLPLRRFASGGIATGPTAAIFAEGGMNEAFVPLPDGRRIDVNLRERRPAAQGNVVVHMNVSTPDANSFRRSQGQMLGELQAQLSRAGGRR